MAPNMHRATVEDVHSSASRFKTGIQIQNSSPSIQLYSTFHFCGVTPPPISGASGLDTVWTNPPSHSTDRYLQTSGHSWYLCRYIINASVCAVSQLPARQLLSPSNLRTGGLLVRSGLLSFTSIITPLGDTWANTFLHLQACPHTAVSSATRPSRSV